MRILLLTQWFDPEPTFKGLIFAKALRDRGHEVQVVTGFPSYPGGRIYPGYRVRLMQRESIDGIEVLRVPLYPSHDRSAIRRSLNYLSFALSSSLLGSLLARPADVVYAYHPPGSIALPAFVLSRLLAAPLVLDVQDLWPDSLPATGMMRGWFTLGMIERLCDWMYRSSTRIAVLSPGFREILVSRGVPEEKVRVIYNWCDESAITPGQSDDQLARELGLAGRFNVVFAGTLGLAQGLDTVLDAAELCRSSCPAVQFVLVGAGVDRERLVESAASRGLTNVLFLPRQTYAGVSRILSLADVLLVHLRDMPLFRITIPSKTQAYLAMGRPILMAVSGDAARVVERAGAGITCPPDDAAALAASVEHMTRMNPGELAAMGRRGRDFYMREMSLASGVDAFESLFRGALEDRRLLGV